jgi:hypothetical protein
MNVTPRYNFKANHPFVILSNKVADNSSQNTRILSYYFELYFGVKGHNQVKDNNKRIWIHIFI